MKTYGPVQGQHFLAWIETDTGLVAIDTGHDAAWNKVESQTSDLAALRAASVATGKPLTHVLLTHDHADHTANLPLLLEEWPEAEVLAHPAGGTEGVTGHLHGGETLEPGGTTIQVLHVPGHSAAGDELSFYLPAHRFLFTGDVAQPQGPSYSFANGPSPVPFFHDGERYHDSLERLIGLDAEYARTGHGDFLGPEQVRQWLRVTLATVLRIQELAFSLVERYPQKEVAWLAESIFDQIADERHFGFRRARQRKEQSSYAGATDYERFDLPGLRWAATEARGVVVGTAGK